MNTMLSNCQLSFCAHPQQLSYLSSFIPIHQCQSFIPIYINNFNSNFNSNHFNNSNEINNINNLNNINNVNGSEAQISSRSEINQINQFNSLNQTVPHSHNSQVSNKSEFVSSETCRKNDTENCEQCVLRKPTLPSINQSIQFNQNYQFNGITPLKEIQINGYQYQCQQSTQMDTKSENGTNIETEEVEEGSDEMEEDISDGDEFIHILPKEQLPLTPNNLRFYKNLYWFEKVKRIEEWLEEENESF